MLCFAEEDLASWEQLAETRRSQGWQLEIWDALKFSPVALNCVMKRLSALFILPKTGKLTHLPSLKLWWQLLSTMALPLSLAWLLRVYINNHRSSQVSRICNQIHTNIGQLDVDWLVVASGLGSSPLTAALEQPVDIKPVLGQALHMWLDHPLGNPDFQPVITGDDVHIVPLGEGEYWVGATVEFPNEVGDVVAEPRCWRR
jgi:glycine oxidase